MKIKRLEMSYQFLIHHMITGRMIECIDGLPADAKVLGLYFDNDHRQISIDVESSSYDEVPEGGVVPKFIATFKMITAGKE